MRGHATQVPAEMSHTHVTHVSAEMSHTHMTHVSAEMSHTHVTYVSTEMSHTHVTHVSAEDESHKRLAPRPKGYIRRGFSPSWRNYFYLEKFPYSTRQPYPHTRDLISILNLLYILT